MSLNEKWGPSFWKFLHALSFFYPKHPSEKQKKKYESFLLSFEEFIPCEKCKKDYEKYISEKKPNLDSKKEFVIWVIDLHNFVNKKLGKKIYTYEEVESQWNENNEPCLDCLNIQKEKPPFFNIKVYLKIFQFFCFFGFLFFLCIFLEKKYKLIEFFKNKKIKN